MPHVLLLCFALIMTQIAVNVCQRLADHSLFVLPLHVDCRQTTWGLYLPAVAEATATRSEEPNTVGTLAYEKAGEVPKHQGIEHLHSHKLRKHCGALLTSCSRKRRPHAARGHEQLGVCMRLERRTVILIIEVQDLTLRL